MNHPNPICRPLYLIWLSVFLLIGTSPGVQAQTTGKYPYPDQPNGKYFKSYLTLSKNLVTSPVRWGKKEWITAGGVATTGVLLYVYDDQIRGFFQRNQSTAITQISKHGLEPWGSGLYPALLMGGCYIYGWAANDPTSRQIALGGTQAWVMSAVTVMIIKNLTHRHRPYQDLPANPRLWEGPFKGMEYTSFPSGHTITAFSLASFLSSAYRDKHWVGIVSYTIATGVGISRLYDDQHWSTDVFIGAALGFGIGKLVFSMMDPESNLSMQVGSEGGIGLVYKF